MKDDTTQYRSLKLAEPAPKPGPVTPSDFFRAKPRTIDAEKAKQASAAMEDLCLLQPHCHTTLKIAPCGTIKTDGEIDYDAFESIADLDVNFDMNELVKGDVTDVHVQFGAKNELDYHARTPTTVVARTRSTLSFNTSDGAQWKLTTGTYYTRHGLLAEVEHFAIKDNKQIFAEGYVRHPGGKVKTMWVVTACTDMPFRVCADSESSLDLFVEMPEQPVAIVTDDKVVW